MRRAILVLWFTAITGCAALAGTLSEAASRAVVPGPDLLIKRATDPDTAFALNDVYQTSPSGGQSVAASTGSFGLYLIRVQNDDTVARSYVLRAVESGSAGWKTSYYVNATGAEITAPLHSGAGYTTPALPPGGVTTLLVIVFPTSAAAGGSSTTSLIRAHRSASDATVRDSVRATTRLNVAAQPDLLVKSAGESDTAYGTNDLYQATPSGNQVNRQIARARNVNGQVVVGQAAAEHVIALQNDGNTPRQFTLKATESTEPGWTRSYLAYADGQTPVSVTGALLSASGYTTPAIVPGNSLILVMRMTADSTVTGGTTRSVTVKAFLSPTDTTVRDSVQAVSIVETRADLLIKGEADPETAYVGSRVYEATPSTQTRSDRVDVAGGYAVKLVNVSTGSHSFVLRALEDLPAGWSTGYVEASTGADISAQIRSASAYTTPVLRPGASWVILFRISADQTTVGGPAGSPAQVRLRAFLNASDPVVRDSVLAFTALAPRPDLAIKNRSQNNTQYGGNDIYQPVSSGVQVRSQRVQQRQTATFDVSVANDGFQTRDFVLTATESGDGGWFVRYFLSQSGQVTDVTDQILSPAGYAVTLPGPSSFLLIVEMTAPGFPFSNRSTVIRAVRANVSAEAQMPDAVRASAEVEPVIGFTAGAGRPDLLVKRAGQPDSAFATEGVFQQAPAGSQVVEQSIAAGTAATYHVRVRNSGSTARSFFLRAAEVHGPGWFLSYHAGGMDIAGRLRGAGGYETPVLPAGAAHTITVTIASESGMREGLTAGAVVRAFVGAQSSEVLDALQVSAVIRAP